MPNQFRGLLFAGVLSSLSLPVSAIVIGVADPGTGNCYPFGCSSGWTPEYQQVYDSSYFTGVTEITSLSFYNTMFDSGNYTPNSGTYTFSLSTTGGSVDGLSSTAGTNLGADNTVVFTGSLSSLGGAFGGQMDIILDTSFFL